MSRSLRCVCCPRGCLVTVDRQGAVTGNGCRNGSAFAREQRSTAPTRVAAQVRIRGAAVEYCPVKTDRPVESERLPAVEAALRALTVDAPVYVSQVLVRDIGGSGANLVSAATLRRAEPETE